MEVYILTSEWNEYGQHDEYFEHVFESRPTVGRLMRMLGCTQSLARHIQAGGGRIDAEQQWWHLRRFTPD